MSNAAGHERDQFGTRMSAGLDWSLGRMPLPFSIFAERHALWQKSAMNSLSWLSNISNKKSIPMHIMKKFSIKAGGIKDVMFVCKI